MNFSEIKELLKCAVSHECALDHNSKCAWCEIGFEFMAENPVMLACGHAICWYCHFERKETSFDCKIHGNTSVCGDGTLQKLVLQANANELFQTLRDKFSKTVQLLKGI